MTDEVTILQFDWEEVEGLEVVAVVAIEPRRMDDGSLVCDQLALIVGARAVVIRVNDDTDEVIVSLKEAIAIQEPEWQTLEQLQEIVSCRLGWCWSGRNYRGYLDTFTVALDGIDPGYSFVGMASSLHCMRVTPVLA